MGLNINTTDIQLGIECTPSSLQIETQSARLELHQKQAKVNISTEKPKVLIDQYQCFAEAGHKNNYDLAKDTTRLAYRQVMKFISEKVQEGYTLAAIENGGNPIAYIAARKANPQKEFGLAFIPQSRPKIEVTGSINTQFEKNGEGIQNGVDGNYIQGHANINFTPSNVDVYVKQYPSVDINYEPSVDISI